jgi:hypothetical protein
LSITGLGWQQAFMNTNHAETAPLSLSCGAGMLAAVEPQPGTYALLFSARANGLVWIGRLGRLRLQSGFYVYIGSPLGSGGVRGRLMITFDRDFHFRAGLAIIGLPRQHGWQEETDTTCELSGQGERQ